MNGIHDLGGMHGFGSIDAIPDEPVFHEPWEATCFALNLVLGGWRKWNTDMSRHAIERLDPAVYLTSSYYERWLVKIEMLALEGGLVTAEELRSGEPDPGAPRLTPPVDAAAIRALVHTGRSSERSIDAPPRFAVGDEVVANRDAPHGHTRLPRYARGARGEIVLHHRAHVFPDRNARREGEAPEHLYSVRFRASELWGHSGASQ